MRRLYVDVSPGEGWDGREPEALLAASPSSASSSSATTFDADGLAALAATPRPLALLVGGETPSDAPATATLTGTGEDDAALSETVALAYSPLTGDRRAGAVSGKKVFKTLAQVDFPAGAGAGATVAVGFGLVPGTGDVRRRLEYATLWEALGDRSSGQWARLSVLRVTGYCEDASRKVDGALATPNGNYNVPFELSQIGDLGRIALDFFVGMVGTDHPTVVVVDHDALMKRAEADLAKVRTAAASAGTSPPDPAANVGGAVGAIGYDADPPATFTGCLGDFA